MSIVQTVKAHGGAVIKEFKGMDNLDENTKNFKLYKFLEKNIKVYPYLLEELPSTLIVELLLERFGDEIKNFGSGFIYEYLTDNVIKKLDVNSKITLRKELLRSTGYYDLVAKLTTEENPLPMVYDNGTDVVSILDYLHRITVTHGMGYFVKFLNSLDKITCNTLVREMIDYDFFGKNLVDNSTLINLIQGNFGKNLDKKNLASLINCIHDEKIYLWLLSDDNIYNNCKDCFNFDYLKRKYFENVKQFTSDKLCSMEKDIVNDIEKEIASNSANFNEIVINNKMGFRSLFMEVLVKQLILNDSIEIYKIVLMIEKYSNNIDDIIDEKFMKKIFNERRNILDSKLCAYVTSWDGKGEKFLDMLFHSRTFQEFIKKDEDLTFNIMYFINMYDIHNEYIDKLNRNFAVLQKARPELSWFNSSLKKEMLEDKVINTLGGDYLNIVLNFDTKATDVVVQSFYDNDLDALKEYIDFVVSITKNIRNIHRSIINYNSVKELYNSIKDKNLNEDEMKLFLEIVRQNNIYNIKNYEELNRYFDIKAQVTLKKEELTEVDFNRLFLNYNGAINKSYLKITSYSKEDFEYIKYKYLDTGVISEREFSYLLDFAHLYNRFFIQKDISLEQAINNWPYKDEILFDNVKERMYKAWSKERENLLTSKEDLEKAKENGTVFSEYIDGVEVMHLRGYDYKFITSTMRQKANGADYHRVTFSDGEFNALVKTVGEKLKSKYGKDFIKTEGADVFINNPEVWYELEGVPTISTSPDLPDSFRCASYVYGYVWGSDSGLRIYGVDTQDAQVAHEVRTFALSGLGKFSNDKESFYTSNTGGNLPETWIDRCKEDLEDGKIKRLAPEFIRSTGAGTAAIKQAKYFNCPILVNDFQYYDSKFVEKKLLTITKKILENSDVSVFDEFIYSNASSESVENRVDMVIKALKANYNSGKISREELVQKLTSIKWNVYEEFGKTNPMFKKVEEECNMYSKELDESLLYSDTHKHR